MTERSGTEEMQRKTMQLGRSARRTRGRFVSGALAGFALVGSIGLAVAVASPSGAAANSHKSTKTTNHKKTKSTTPSIATLESELKTIINAGPGPGTTLNEAGSSLFYPLYQEWAGASNLPVKLNPAAGGSGKGISEAAAGTVQIGASDAFLAGSQRTGPPALVNVPVVVSAQAICYNLPSIPASTHLKLTPTILNDIYDGAITNWSNKLIAKANPGVTLPNQTIIPIRRIDGSGDTFLFTSYMWYGDKTSWNHAAPYYGPQLSYASWPSVNGELAENGNAAMVTALNANVGGVAYVGVSYLASINGDHLGQAKILNGSGNYELPDGATISAEISSYGKFPSDGALNLVFSKAKAARFGYPIVNFEYAIVAPSELSSTQLAAVKAMLAWGMDPADGASSTYLNPIDFKPLPPSAIAGALTLVKSL
jgi:phosphate transport system substrate-binding protein